MKRIRPIRQSDIKKIVKMIEYVTPGMFPGMIDNKNLIPFPLNILHKLLPLHLKFMQECYVAVEDNEPFGLISLVPDGYTKTRWKINRLALREDAYDTGKQLIDYVVNKYSGVGAETFITVIDENCPEAIALFKNACSFRNCSKINIWECESFRPETEKTEFIREALQFDAKRLFALDSEAILPCLRPSLVKTVMDFRLDLAGRMMDKFRNYKTDKYVLDNPRNDLLEGLLSIQTVDNIHFWVDITLSLGYQQYYENLVNFAIKKIRGKNNDAKIYFGVKDHYQTEKFMTEFLASQGFKLCGNFQVLVKDYWKPIRDYKEKVVPVIAFPDMTSPACNITPFTSEFYTKAKWFPNLTAKRTHSKFRKT